MGRLARFFHRSLRDLIRPAAAPSTPCAEGESRDSAFPSPAEAAEKMLPEENDAAQALTSSHELREELEMLRSTLHSEMKSETERGLAARRSARAKTSAIPPGLEFDYERAHDLLKRIHILAFIGPSGTGKSTRAPRLSAERGYSYIIDDALLIKGTKILAGTTAKRAETRMESVRQAIFFDETRAATMRRALLVHAPEKLMILGTSDGMLLKICRHLWLSEPHEIVRIDEVATEAEQREARASRLQGGHHTIPVAGLEIQHEFSGYISDPMAALRRGLEKRRDLPNLFAGSERVEGMDLIRPEDRTVVRPSFSSLGRYRISDEAMKSLIRLVARECEGVDEVIKIHLQSQRPGVEISLRVALLYGYNAEESLRKAQREIKDKIEKLSSVNVISIDLRAVKLVRKEEKWADFKRTEGRGFLS